MHELTCISRTCNFKYTNYVFVNYLSFGNAIIISLLLRFNAKFKSKFPRYSLVRLPRRYVFL